MTKGGIRKYLYKAITRATAVPFHMVSFPLLCFYFLNDLIWKPKNISKHLKSVISAPLIILFLLVEVPSIILASLIVSTLVIANVILFPDLFFPLWIKERVNLSRVFSIYLPNQLHVINFEDFLKIKNNNRKLLVALLKSNNLNVQDVISFHKDYSELVKSITTEIHDHEKSKIIFDYLGLSNVKLLIAKDTYSQHCLHAVYKTCKNNIKVINDIDIGLFKEFFKLDVYSTFNSSRNVRATKLSNIIHLLKDHYLAKNISDAFSSNTQSSLVKIIKYFSQKNMDIQELTLLTSMLQDKNVLENLKRIDNINSILPDTLTSEDFSFFLNLRKILCNHTTYCFINNLYSLLSNNRLFDKFDSIPTKVLKDICSTELYITCKNANEVLAFFDCLDDHKKNKNILDNLKTAFETDSEATLAFLNNELFNSQDEILEVMKHENFDGSKVREILNRTNLVRTLEKNALIYAPSINAKTICIFNLWYVIHLFYKQVKRYCLARQQKNYKNCIIKSKNTSNPV